MRPAPQGRGYRVRKRSNHVTVIVDTVGTKVPKVVAKEVVETAEVVAPKKASTKKTTKKD
jgi:large subunit ribosomal protein L22